MSFTNAISTCFRKYVDFTGRARRSEYWWWFLFTTLIGTIAVVLDDTFGTESLAGSSTGLVEAIVTLAIFLPSLAVLARRLHDTDRSGWWMLIGVIPILGWIVILILTVQDSQPQPNRHGPNPKGIDSVPTPGMPRGY